MNKDNLKPIIHEIEYGKVCVKLDELMKEKNISTYSLSTQANVRFQTIQVLRKNRATRMDFEVLAKLCYALNCKVGDIIEYVETK